MTTIIPAVLPKNFEDLKRHIGSICGYSNFVQIDICDGIFVENKSWPYTEKNDLDFAKIQNERLGMPFWDEIEYEIDLMINEPENEIEKFILLGASKIVVHFESVKNLTSLVNYFQKNFPEEAKPLGSPELGLAIGVDTPVEAIIPYIPNINFVQCMGISNIGMQGQPFNSKALSQVSLLREMYRDLEISVDGGVNLDNAEKIIRAGANRLVVGSAIFESEDICEALESFKKIV